MSRFIVGVELNDEDEKKFLAYIKEKRWAWWHRIANFWMLVDEQDETSASEIRDFLIDLPSCKKAMVLPGGNRKKWSGVGPRSTLEEHFAWVRSNWENAVEED